MLKHGNNYSFDHRNLNEIDDSNDFLTIQRALVTYHRDSVYSSWKMLEQHKSKIDPDEEPGVFAEFDRINEILFNAWLQFGGV